MSIVNIPSLSKKELLFHYVLDCQNRGLSLPYADLQILEQWMQEIGEDSDALLLILSDILPKYYADKKKRVPLKRIQKSVSTKIKEHLISQTTPSLVHTNLQSAASTLCNDLAKS